MHVLIHFILIARTSVVFSSTDEENETQKASKRPKVTQPLERELSNLSGLSKWHITLAAEVPAPLPGCSRTKNSETTLGLAFQKISREPTKPIQVLPMTIAELAYSPPTQMLLPAVQTHTKRKAMKESQKTFTILQTATKT